jgi:hypothetical protein
MFDHKDVQIFVGILLCAALLLLFSLLFWAVAAIRKRIENLEAEPQSPETEKSKPTRIMIKTETGTYFEYGTNLLYPPNGQLLVMSNDKLCGIFAAGKWRSAQAVPEPPVETKEEPVAPNPPNQV